MASERLYHQDPYVTRFRARVVRAGERDGRPAVELDATHFYPEGGGQLGDHGTLGGRAVVDVQAGDDGAIWHVLEDGPCPAGEVEGELDWSRRFDHMQQHTGQHVLSAAFEREAGAPTLSSTLGAEHSVIETAMAKDPSSPLAGLLAVPDNASLKLILLGEKRVFGEALKIIRELDIPARAGQYHVVP